MIETGLIEYVIALIGGFFAGIVNSLAGNGSAITLTILTEVLDLPGNIANGTNRLGVFSAAVGAYLGFRKNKRIEYSQSKLILITILFGALCGVIVAAFYTSNNAFMEVFKYMMLLMLPILLLRPKRWLHNEKQTTRIPILLRVFLYLILGFYAGFIQMGMGIFFLVIAVLLDGFDLFSANIIKNLAVLILTTIALMIFQYQGLVNWRLGGVLALGQVTGAFLAVNLAAKSAKANEWTYRLLIFIIIMANLKLFGVFG